MSQQASSPRGRWKPVFNAGEEGHRLDLPGGASLICSTQYTCIRYPAPYFCLSSAVLNGGLVNASEFLNMRVETRAEASEPPAKTLQDFATGIGCTPLVVGMMTAASMKSLRVYSDQFFGQDLAVVVTTGLENARRAGDPADYHGGLQAPPAGTINLAIITGFATPVATMVEITTIASEAKAAVMQELAIVSPVSGGVATGTGTDAIAVFAPHEGQEQLYAGKHTVLGEGVARLVIAAIRDSIGGEWQSNQDETANA